MNKTLSPASSPKPFSDAERDEFYRHYAVAALWSTNDEAGNPLDNNADLDDIIPDTVRKMREDCNDFIDSNLAALRDCGLSVEQMGHDFWLTRNGHGAGFWDRGIGKLGTTLSDAAKVYGSVFLYLGENGKVDCG